MVTDILTVSDVNAKMTECKSYIIGLVNIKLSVGLYVQNKSVIVFLKKRYAIKKKKCKAIITAHGFHN